MRPFGLEVPEAPRTLGDGRDGRTKVSAHAPPSQHNFWHPRAPPQPGMPAWMPACVVSPGPLPHVCWQSVPSCLHSSAVKTVTSGPGPAGTPLSVRACVLVRVYGDTPAGTRLSVPIHGCTFVCTAVPWVPVSSWTCVCAGTHGGAQTSVWTFTSTRGAGGLLQRPQHSRDLNVVRPRARLFPWRARASEPPSQAPASEPPSAGLGDRNKHARAIAPCQARVSMHVVTHVNLPGTLGGWRLYGLLLVYVHNIYYM